MNKVLKLLSFALAILIFVLLFTPFILGIDGVSSLLGMDIENISIKGTAKVFEFSLVDRYPIILLVGLIFISLFTYIGLATNKTVSTCVLAFNFLKSYLKDTVRLILNSNVKYFLLFSFLTSLLLGYFYPLTLDEPQTYYDFIKPPFWHALALYPYPNNHVLSSLLSNITNEIPGLDLLFRIRIPAILLSLFTWIFAYRFVRKFFSENTAILLVAIGSVIVTNLQHAYIARGYAFVMFFVVIGLYAAYNIIHEGNRRRDWLALAISTALGAWAMPSYLYPFLSISIFIFVYNYKHLKTQILYSLLVGVLVFILYSPILIFSGLESLTSNEFVATIDRLTVIKTIPEFMLGTLIHIFYAPYYLLLIPFVLVGIYMLVKRDRKAIIFWLIFGLTPSLFLLLHSVIPFYRTFFYYGFIFVFMLITPLDNLLKNISQKKILACAIALHIALLAYFVSVSRELMTDVFLSYELRKEVLGDKKTYYIDDGISWIEIVNLDFEAERRGFDITSKGGTINDVEKLQEYDYCLIRTQSDKTIKYMPLKQTKAVFSVDVNIYKNEKR